MLELWGYGSDANNDGEVSLSSWRKTNLQPNFLIDNHHERPTVLIEFQGCKWVVWPTISGQITFKFLKGIFGGHSFAKQAGWPRLTSLQFAETTTGMPMVLNKWIYNRFVSRLDTSRKLIIHQLTLGPQTPTEKSKMKVFFTQNVRVK